ncbi:MAG: hypothetical protein ACXQTM_00480 [Methanosarcinales archaeon]
MGIFKKEESKKGDSDELLQTILSMLEAVKSSVDELAKKVEALSAREHGEASTEEVSEAVKSAVEKCLQDHEEKMSLPVRKAVLEGLESLGFRPVNRPEHSPQAFPSVPPSDVTSVSNEELLKMSWEEVHKLAQLAKEESEE